MSPVGKWLAMKRPFGRGGLINHGHYVTTYKFWVILQEVSKHILVEDV